MTDELTIFGKAVGEKQWTNGDTYRRSLSHGLFFFYVDYHTPNFPESPWHGVSGQLVIGTTVIAAFSANDNRDHRWLGTESEVVAFLESEARRIMRECFEIAGEMVVVQEKIAPDFIRVAPVKFSYEAK